MEMSFLAYGSAILALGCVIITAINTINAQKHAAYAKSCADWMAENNKRSKVVRLEAEMTEIVDSMVAIREALHKMRSRAGMREYRAKQKEAENDAPAADTPEGRDAERAALEAELAKSGRLNARIHQQG